VPSLDDRVCAFLALVGQEAVGAATISECASIHADGPGMGADIIEFRRPAASAPSKLPRQKPDPLVMFLLDQLARSVGLDPSQFPAA
jgi:hypothetical protein